MPQKIIAPEGQAYCGRCKKFLLKEKFHKDLKRPSGCARYCGECMRVYNRVRLGYNKKVVRVLPAGLSWCCRCKTAKPSNEFTTSDRTSDGRHSWCKICINAYQYRERREVAVRKFGPRNNRTEFPCVISASHDIAYVAGLVDAEGCIQIGNGTNALVSLTISNNNLCLLQAAKKVFGGTISKFSRPFRQKGKTERRPAQIAEGRLRTIGILETENSLSLILPFLVLKKKQCQLALDALKVHPLERRKFAEEMAELNKKMPKDRCEVMTRVPELSLVEVENFSEEDVAYLAGLTDGDGWIGFDFFTSDPSLVIYSARPLFVRELQARFGGTSKVKERGKYIACNLYLKMSRDVWPLLLKRLENYLVLKKRHAQLLREHLEQGTDFMATKTEMQRLTRLARMEKFKLPEDDSNMGRFFSLDQYSKKDEFGAGPKGQKMQIEKAETTAAEDLGIKMFTLAEYAEKTA